MKSHLEFIPTGDMTTEDWLRYRMTGIGASEVGTIMGLNPYKSSIQLFYEKIGEPVYDPENMAMFCGKELESFIAKMWEFWDGSESGMIANFRAGKKVRRCQRVNAYVRNPRFPWLFVSLDRKINKFDGRGEGSLEVKTLGGWEQDKWEGGIPPGHVVQVQTQILVCEFEFGEMAVFNDNRNLDVLPFEYNENICSEIISRTKDFWQRVEAGRAAVTRRFEAQRTYNHIALQDAEAELQKLEPEPDGSQAYADFLKKKYNIAPPGERSGTLEQLIDARAHKRLAGQIKELEEQKRLYENRLKAVLRDGADCLTFGENGFISWKTDVNNVRRFLNKIKGENRE